MKFAPVFFAVAGLLAAPVPARAGDAPGPVATVEAFDDAIARGKEAKARELLMPDVLVYESGGEEGSLEEYARQHLGADIAFMKQVKREVLGRQHGESGDLAWVATRRRLTGTYKDKAVDVYGTETMVLARGPLGWRIRHIHWSSQRAAPPAP